MESFLVKPESDTRVVIEEVEVELIGGPIVISSHMFISKMTSAGTTGLAGVASVTRAKHCQNT